MFHPLIATKFHNIALKLVTVRFCIHPYWSQLSYPLLHFHMTNTVEKAT